jgi:hypothetical protein
MGNKNSNNLQKTNQAILDYSNGEKYRGEIVDGLRNGFGTYFYQNGERYEGDWLKNVKQGRGTFFYKNGGVYEGFWNNNKREGVGTYYNNNGDRYYGEWKDNKKHGKGILHLEDGCKFVGQFKNNKKQGFGEFINKDGHTIYEEWKDGTLVRQFEKPKASGKYTEDINYHELNTGAFEKYLDTKTKQQSELKSNLVKSKYFTLEFAKKLKSKNPDNYYDSVRLMHNINNIIVEKPDMMSWGIDDVAALFKKLGLEAFIETAIKLDIDGNKLTTISFDELTHMLGMTDNREKKALLNTIDFFKKYANKRGEAGKKSLTQTGIMLIEEEQIYNKSEEKSFEETTQKQEKDIEEDEKKIEEVEKKDSLNSPSNFF